MNSAASGINPRPEIKGIKTPLDSVPLAGVCGINPRPEIKGIKTSMIGPPCDQSVGINPRPEIKGIKTPANRPITKARVDKSTPRNQGD